MLWPNETVAAHEEREEAGHEFASVRMRSGSATSQRRGRR